MKSYKFISILLASIYYVISSKESSVNELTKDNWEKLHSDVGLFIQTDNFILWRLLRVCYAVNYAVNCLCFVC
jgi:hypothetical protein